LPSAAAAPGAGAEGRPGGPDLLPPLEIAIAFLGVVLAAGNAVGGYAVTERMLEMFKSSKGKR
jgi:hypothetical protein